MSRRRLFRLPDREGAAREEVEDEIRFHLERRVEKLRAGGMTEEEARAEAARRFGNVETVRREMARETRRREGRMRMAERADRLRQDLGYALRQLRRSRGFTAVALLTLALGIGATTAIFSVVDGILLRPLPFEEPDELVRVWSDWTRRGGPADEWPNFPNLWRLREEARTLDALGIWGGGGATLTGLGSAEAVATVAVDHHVFGRVLRVEPALGRGFAPADDAPGAPGTALVSHGFWQRALGGDPAALGRDLTLNGERYTVIGVMGEDFRPPFSPQAELWTPLRMDPSDHACGRGGACLFGIARLADGATLTAARAEADGIARRGEADDPEANAGMGWNLQPFHADLVADARTGLLVLMAAALFVLLIACVNQANLLLARGSSRRSELALRSAIGAGRGRIVAQLLTESLVLALLGGAAGVGCAFLLTDLLVALAPVGTPRLDEVGVDRRVLAFAAGVTALSGLLFGLLPALRGARGAIHQTLREGSRGATRAAGARRAMVAVQVALALVLLVGSGLLLRSFQKLRAVDLGFDPSGVLTFRVTLPAVRYEDAAALRAFLPLVEERLAALPGVESVGATSNLPLAGLNGDVSYFVEGKPLPRPDQAQAVWFRRSTAGLLGTLRVPLLRGRGLDPGDGAESMPVAVVNETLAARWFEGEDPIGRRIGIGDPADPTWLTIVGVARDVKHFGVRDAAQEALYTPYAQFPTRTMFFALRSPRDPAGLAGEVRQALAALDPELAAAALDPLDRYVGDALASERFVTALLLLFAGVAVTLAVVGLYGVVSYDVNGRLREMGVRLALGASGGDVGALVVRGSLGVVALGVAAGIVGALLLTRLMGSLLFGVSPTDPLTFVAVALGLAAASALAAALPARRAARVDPVEVLRAE